MKLRVLGCSGGIGAHLGARALTTSFLLDDDVLIDAGTGVEDLSVEELAAVNHVFLTHSHLDHIASLPMMVDSVGHLRNKPLIVHALPETISALRAHIFNWVIWPDFCEIPHYERPYMTFEPITLGMSVQIGEKRVRALPANHSVPALGYEFANSHGAIVFSGDTSPNDEFWQVVNAIRDLRVLIIETAFPNREQDLATLSKHLYPIQLGQELKKLHLEPIIYVTHLKPSDRDLITKEIAAWAGNFAPEVLVRSQIIEI
jgi:ribonuclease BN (tRNA processing enzyme)